MVLNMKTFSVHKMNLSMSELSPYPDWSSVFVGTTVVHEPVEGGSDDLVANDGHVISHDLIVGPSSPDPAAAVVGIQLGGLHLEVEGVAIVGPCHDDLAVLKLALLTITLIL